MNDTTSVLIAIAGSAIDAATTVYAMRNGFVEGNWFRVFGGGWIYAKAAITAALLVGLWAMGGLGFAWIWGVAFAAVGATTVLRVRRHKLER